MKPMNIIEAMAAFSQDLPFLLQNGIVPHTDARSYVADRFLHDFGYAMDAQPDLITAPNSGIPAFLTTMVDPKVYEILLAPNAAAKIIGEQKRGDWLEETAMFPTIERTGEVSSYGDFAENGRSGLNINWPQRQSYLFQCIMEYGERELERAGLARINWVSELNGAAATIMAKFQNLTYFFGVRGLQNYGLINDPNLSAALTPAAKAFGNSRWITSGVVTATANEVYNDIVSLYSQLVSQSTGLVDQDTPMVLALSPNSAVALTATNSFNVNVNDLLTKNFKNIRIQTAVQYGSLSAQNPQGLAGGELVQLIAESAEGQDVGYAAFNEKMRSGKIINALSSYKQKVTGGTWGTILRQPFLISQMQGV